MSHPFFSALSIAGSDPSGGAGIQVDLKTFAKTGVWGMAVITALTAQNPVRVSGAWPVNPDIVSEQIQTLLEDITPGAVKTGMLANAEIIKAVYDALPPEITLVIDPVMVSTSGHQLLDADAVQDLITLLIPRATIVTPNIPEAEILTGMKGISGEEAMEEAGRKILDLGAEYVLLKGGHGSGDTSVDLLISRSDVIRLSHKRLPYDVHGSGCSFSAAITGYLAREIPVPEACEKAKKVVSSGIEDALHGKSGRRMIHP